MVEGHIGIRAHSQCGDRNYEKEICAHIIIASCSIILCLYTLNHFLLSTMNVSVVTFTPAMMVALQWYCPPWDINKWCVSAGHSEDIILSPTFWL